MLARLWNAEAVSSNLVSSGGASAQRMTGGSVSRATVSGPLAPLKRNPGGASPGPLTEPQRDVPWPHRLVYRAAKLGLERLQVDLLA